MQPLSELLTWLWQGTALAVGVWGLLRLLPAKAATRFTLWWATLLALVTLLVTPSLLSHQAISRAISPTGASIAGFLAHWGGTVLAMSVGAWLGLALLGFVHLGVRVSHLRRVKRACRPFPLARERRLPRWLAARDKGRPARLCLSDDVCPASALGLELGSDGAIVAINPTLLSEVDDNELDQIVLHEYAHIQRWDDWLHLLQLALQALLVVHPAVSGIGRALRRCCSAACDDWVIDRTQMPATYARCLTKMRAFELATPNDLIAAMSFGGRGDDLARRHEWLLARRRIARARLAALPVATSVAVLLIAATVGLSQLPPLVATGGSSLEIGGTSLERADADIVDISARSGAVTTAVKSWVDPLAMAAAVVVKPEPFDAGARSGWPKQPDSQPRRVASTGASTRRAVSAWPTLDASREAARQGAIPQAPDTAEQASAPSALRAASAEPLAAHTLEMTSSPIAVPLPSSALGPGFGLGMASNAAAVAGASVHADASEAENTLADADQAKSRRALQRVAGVGATVGQGAANVGVTVGQGVATVGTTVGQGAKHVGTATGGFFTHVVTSIARALP
jgi:beta-lactamase regulating signal transducer with metallopeptidase domain